MDKIGLAHAYDPGALKVTIRKFYRPGGASTQLRGVRPHRSAVPQRFREVSESTLKDPLPWDAVAPAPHERCIGYSLISALYGRSPSNGLKDGKGLCPACRRPRSSQEEPGHEVGLVERSGTPEGMAHSKARQDESKRESRIHPLSRPTTYEITLKNVSSPGLPPPMAATKSSAQAQVAESSSAPNAIGRIATNESADDDIVLERGRENSRRLCRPLEQRNPSR